MARCVKGKYRVKASKGARRCYTKAKGKSCACPKGRKGRRKGKR